MFHLKHFTFKSLMLARQNMKIFGSFFLILIVLTGGPFVNCNDDIIFRKNILDKFYGSIPAPFEAPKQSRTSQYSPILLAAKIQNVDFSKSANGIICRSTIHLQVSWQLQNEIVLKSPLFWNKESILVDESKTWVPKIEFENSRDIKIFSTLLELRKSKDKKQKQADFILSKSVNIEVLCESSSVYYPFSTIFCPIHLKQGGIVNSIRWKEQDGCIATDEVSKKSSFVNIDKKYSKVLNTDDYKHYLRVGICWQEGDYLVRIYLPSSVIMTIAFVSLWNTSPKLQTVSLCSCLCALLILWISSHLDRFGIITSIDIWLAICFITVSVGLCLLLLMRNSNKKESEFGKESRIGDVIFDSPESPRYILPSHDPYDTHTTTGKDYNIKYQTTYRQALQTTNKSDQKWTVIKVLILILFIITITLYWIIILVMASTPVECSENTRCNYAN